MTQAYSKTCSDSFKTLTSINLKCLFKDSFFPKVLSTLQSFLYFCRPLGEVAQLARAQHS